MADDKIRAKLTFDKKTEDHYEVNRSSDPYPLQGYLHTTGEQWVFLTLVSNMGGFAFSYRDMQSIAAKLLQLNLAEEGIEINESLPNTRVRKTADRAIPSDLSSIRFPST